MNLLLSWSLLIPVWFGDPGVEEMCQQSGVQQYTHRGETKEFNVHLTSREDMYDICGNARNGKPARACIQNNYDIYVTPGMMCSHSMAHELSHGFGMHFVDRPVIHEG